MKRFGSVKSGAGALAALVLIVLPALPLNAQELAFVTNQNSSDMSIVNLDTREEMKRVEVPGKAAGVFAASARVYTVSPDDATLREFSHQGELCRAVKLKGGPIAVAVDKGRKRAFVSDWYNAHIYVVDLEGFALVRELETGSAPSGLALSMDGKWLVSADRDANQVSVFDAESLALKGHVAVGERPFGVTISDGGLIYATNVGSNSVSIVDPEALEVVGEISTGERPYGVAFAGGKGFVTDQYADTLTVFDEASAKVAGQMDSGEYPEGIDRNRAQSEIYVANWFSNTLSVMDVSSLEIVAEIEVGDGPRAFGLFVVEGSQDGCDDPL